MKEYTSWTTLSGKFKDPSRSPSHQYVWTHRLVKTVNKEFYIENGFGLFGTIGGTLGIFVGITLLDIFSKQFFGYIQKTLSYRHI